MNFLFFKWRVDWNVRTLWDSRTFITSLLFSFPWSDLKELKGTWLMLVFKLRDSQEWGMRWGWDAVFRQGGEDAIRPNPEEGKQLSSTMNKKGGHEESGSSWEEFRDQENDPCSIHHPLSPIPIPRSLWKFCCLFPIFPPRDLSSLVCVCFFHEYFWPPPLNPRKDRYIWSDKRKFVI